jgi:cobalt-zinc-cadmium efflux system outer membrane protein
MPLPLIFVLAQLVIVPADAPPLRGASGTPPAGAPLTLSMAVAQARTASPRRRGASLAAEGAREAARFAGQLPNPLFELRTENWTAPGRTGAPERDVFAVATQPLELGGRRDIRRQLAATDSAVADTGLGALERELALDTARSYVRALKARALVETLTANREGLAMLVASVDRRVEEGYSPEADLLKFKTEAARVDGDIARAQLELERSLTELTVTIGASAPIQASQLIEPAPIDPPAVPPAAVAASITRHPAVRAATALVERARQVTAYERALRLPEPAVTAGYKRTQGFDTAVLGVSVVLPLFDRNQSSVAPAVGHERAAAADRDRLVFQLTNDADALIRAAHTMSARARVAPAELLGPAEEVRRAARAAFREGASDVLKLIDAERVYTDVRRVAIDVRLDALFTALEARFAIGEETIP